MNFIDAEWGHLNYYYFLSQWNVMVKIIEAGGDVGKEPVFLSLTLDYISVLIRMWGWSFSNRCILFRSIASSTS